MTAADEERALAAEWGVEGLYDELVALAKERGITFEQALVELRAYQFGDPQPILEVDDGKETQEAEPGERGDYVEDPSEQDAAWGEADA